MARTKASVRCLGEELWWAVEQTPSEAQARVEDALKHEEEFVEFTIADPDDEPSNWDGRIVRLRTQYVAIIAPPLKPFEEGHLPPPFEME